MNCLPPRSNILKTKDCTDYLEIIWENKNKVSYHYSCNDQPSRVIVTSDGKLYSREWNGCRYSLKDQPIKPCAIFYDKDGQVRNMLFYMPEPKMLEEIHPDYRDDWVRLYGNKAQTL